jgi:hypothetical protein
VKTKKAAAAAARDQRLEVLRTIMDDSATALECLTERGYINPEQHVARQVVTGIVERMRAALNTRT